MIREHCLVNRFGKSDRMGDCIKQARAFVQGCHESLDRANDSCLQDMTAVLADIQSGAKLNRARAIYRAAQEALHCLEDETRLPLRLHALSNVVALYESGLVEMEAEEIESEVAPLEENVIESADIIPVDFSETARQNRAVDAIDTTDYCTPALAGKAVVPGKMESVDGSTSGGDSAPAQKPAESSNPVEGVTKGLKSLFGN